MRIIKIVIPLFFVILLTSCSSAVWVHRDFESMRDNVKTISVMPPQAAYFQRKAGSTDPEPEHNFEVSNNVQTALKEVLEEKGFIVKPAGLTDSILINNEDLGLCFIRSLKRFHEICDTLGNLRIKKETYKMNPEIGVFAERADADYLLFSRGVAFRTSEGGKIKDAVLTSILNPGRFVQFEGLTLELLLIDANLAEAIWYNTNWPNSSCDSFSLKDIKDLCNKLLKNKLIQKNKI